MNWWYIILIIGLLGLGLGLGLLGLGLHGKGDEGFQSSKTKCYSCQRQDPQRGYGSKCFSCE